MGTGREKPCIVISAVNFVEGGPLSILQDCLAFASRHLADRYDVVALVHRRSLLDFENIRFIEFPHAKRSWFARLHCEYRRFYPVSIRLNPVLWLSLHDMTPNVVATRHAVYCHNPAPFYRLSWRDAWLDPAFALFNLFYRWLYRINIYKNDFVIVQQAWMRARFEKMFGLGNVVVAYPEIVSSEPNPIAVARGSGVCRFLYPAFPRVFKNFEVICEAAGILAGQGITDFEILLTIDGAENRYAKWLHGRFGGIPQLKFIGRQDRRQIYSLYDSADCLIFPSRLETWGLPITEFKPRGRPILAANREYAHETVGNYREAKFFDADDPEELAGLMASIINGTFRPDEPLAVKPLQPFAEGWGRLFELLLENVPAKSSGERV